MHGGTQLSPDIDDIKKNNDEEAELPDLRFCTYLRTTKLSSALAGAAAAAAARTAVGIAAAAGTAAGAAAGTALGTAATQTCGDMATIRNQQQKTHVFVIQSPHKHCTEGDESAFAGMNGSMLLCQLGFSSMTL